jgi:3-methyladenine DNA glycosylase AlkD
MKARALMDALARHASPRDAKLLAGFFKTGPGEYGEGDVFIGVRVPANRRVCAEFRDLPAREIRTLAKSPVHEHRLAAVVILTERFRRAKDDVSRRETFELYMALVREGRVNNWDIVDVSAPHVVGGWLVGRDRSLLFELAESPVLWERRVAVVGSFGLIRAGEPDTTLALCERLLGDPHDLMHKACGWMLREVGKRVDTGLLRGFLARHAPRMPRTMLRYAIEKLPAAERRQWMSR